MNRRLLPALDGLSKDHAHTFLTSFFHFDTLLLVVGPVGFVVAFHVKLARDKDETFWES